MIMNIMRGVDKKDNPQHYPEEQEQSVNLNVIKYG